MSPSHSILKLILTLCVLTLFVRGNELIEENADDHPEVCVTLDRYGDGCKGDVRGSNTFTALTQPGSPCKHTSNMKKNSARDQYCDADGVFHQKVYVQNTHCKVGIAQKAFSPMHLTYTQEKCTYGYKLRSCTPGPCPESPESEVVDSDVVAEVGRLLRGD